MSGPQIFAREPLLFLGPVPVAEAVVLSWAISLLLVVGLALACRRLELRPSRLQAVLELFIEVLDVQIRETTRMEPEPLRPLVGTLFLFILAANWSGLLPGLEAPTAKLEVDAALGATVFLAGIWFGIRHRGLIGYLRTFAEPSWVMIPFNVVDHLMRTLSMIVRLYGNILSGAFVLAIVLSLAGLLVPIPFMALEMLTGAVQAYIFTILGMVILGAGAGSESASGPKEEPHAGNRGMGER